MADNGDARRFSPPRCTGLSGRLEPNVDLRHHLNVDGRFRGGKPPPRYMNHNEHQLPIFFTIFFYHFDSRSSNAPITLFIIDQPMMKAHLHSEAMRGIMSLYHLGMIFITNLNRMLQKLTCVKSKTLRGVSILGIGVIDISFKL